MTAPNAFSPEYTQHFVDAIRAFKRDYKSTAKAQGRACHASHRLAFVQAHLASQGLESDWFTERIVKRYCGADGWAALLEALRMRRAESVSVTSAEFWKQTRKDWEIDYLAFIIGGVTTHNLQALGHDHEHSTSIEERTAGVGDRTLAKRIKAVLNQAASGFSVPKNKTELVSDALRTLSKDTPVTGVGLIGNLQLLELQPQPWPEAVALLDPEFDAAALGYAVVMRTKCVDSVAYFAALREEFRNTAGLRYILPHLFTETFSVDLSQEPNDHDIVLLEKRCKADQSRRNSSLVYCMLTGAFRDFEEAYLGIMRSYHTSDFCNVSNDAGLALLRRLEAATGRLPDYGNVLLHRKCEMLHRYVVTIAI